MKNKAVCFFVVAVTCFLLCGCKGYREADNSYIVTAMGFDGKKKINVSVEVVSAGGSERSEKPQSEIIYGSGKTPMDAIFSLNSQISKNLLFDHCTAIIIGRTLSETHLGEVLEYGNELKELNFAVDMFVCDNAKELLKNSKSVSVSRGFDIAANLKETKSEIGIDYQNKFYEIYSAYDLGQYYNFPFLNIKDKRIIIDGLSIYNKKTEKAHLSNEDALLYSFFTNNNTGGKIYLNDEVADISTSCCSYNSDKNAYVFDIQTKSESKNFKKQFKEKTERMLSKYMKTIGIFSDKIIVLERKDV